MKQVKLLAASNKQLDEIVEARRAKSPHTVTLKQNVVAELIDKAHKREVK